jgi:RND family efflux transporter MFP subunit
MPASRRAVTLGLLVLAVAAGAVVVTGLATRRTEAAQLRERADALAVPTVAVSRPRAGSTANTLELPGRIEAQARAPIYARVSGYLKSWRVDIGARVKAGQLLAEIETPEIDQQLLQAQAELATARANLSLATSTAKRWQALLATDAVSRQEADEKAGDLTAKQSGVNALQANVERIQAQKRFARLEAPFAGVVIARNTDVGALVNAGSGPGSELFVVADTSKLRLYINVPQVYTSAVRPGSTARLTVPEAPGKVFTATVQSMSQAIASGSGSMLVQLSADNAQGALLPGGFAQVSLALPNPVGTLSIPPGALVFNQAGLRVATVGPGDKVVMKTVTIARDQGAAIDIASGLLPDDRVIENPPDGVADGDVVRVAVTAAGKAATAGPAASAPGDRAQR